MTSCSDLFEKAPDRFVFTFDNREAIKNIKTHLLEFAFISVDQY